MNQTADKFLLRNTSVSTFSGLRLDLNLLTISPLVEKIFSAGTDVTGMHKNVSASFERSGKR